VLALRRAEAFRHVKAPKKIKMRELVCSECGKRARMPMHQQWKKLQCGFYCPGKFKQAEKKSEV
jgi:hypothetical protein